MTRRDTAFRPGRAGGLVQNRPKPGKVGDFVGKLWVDYYENV